MAEIMGEIVPQCSKFVLDFGIVSTVIYQCTAGMDKRNYIDESFALLS